MEARRPFLCTVRFAERFLVLLALISILMRLAGMKDGATMELIALPALALFYLLMMPWLLRVVRPEGGERRPWLLIVIATFIGLAMAYCLISLMVFTLGWLPRADMLINCSILLCMLMVGAMIGYRLGYTFLAAAGIRAGVLLACILLLAVLPLPRIGALSEGGF